MGSNVMRLLIAICSGTAALLTAANATVITNGDFQIGDTSGFGLSACGAAITMVDDPVCGFSNVVDPTPFITVQRNGDNDFLQLDSGLGTQIIQAIATQTLNITTDANMLTFDAGLIDVLPGNGTEVFPDLLSISVRNEMGESTTIFQLSDQFGTQTISANGITSLLTAPGDGFFDTGVAVDLSSLVGMTIMLEIGVFSALDGARTLFAVDNFALTGGTVSEVPIPAPLALFATGLIFLRRATSQQKV